MRGNLVSHTQNKKRKMHIYNKQTNRFYSTLSELMEKDPEFKIGFFCRAEHMADNCCDNCWKEVSLINWIDRFLGDIIGCEKKHLWNREDLEWLTESQVFLNVKETNIAFCKRKMTKWCRERFEQVVQKNEMEVK